MTHHLVIILTCDRRGEGRCPAYFIGPSSRDIATVREAAAQKGWKHRPGTPYEHIGATDLCPDHL